MSNVKCDLNPSENQSTLIPYITFQNQEFDTVLERFHDERQKSER